MITEYEKFSINIFEKSYTTGENCVIIPPKSKPIRSRSYSSRFHSSSADGCAEPRKTYRERITRFGDNNQEVSNHVPGQDPHLP